jgi:two-component system, chemotaxis family, response regulator WspF
MRIGIAASRVAEAKLLRAAVLLKREHQVIWMTDSGAAAVELSAKDTPDLLLMGLRARAEAVDAIRRIMASTPCGILIVTASVQRDTGRVFEAMGHGAMDVVDMPASPSLEDATELLERISIVSRLVGDKTVAQVPVCDSRSAASDSWPLVAIGASTGGPAAVAQLLRALPQDFPAAIVLIQHVDAQFAHGMADWLNQQSALPVAVAREGQRLAPGHVLLAGTSDHLVLKAPQHLGYTSEPRQSVYRPSVDVFFESVRRYWRGDAVGVLLTGMGGDGARGLKALRTGGHHTIAQDQDSSVVYGMPKAAATLNAAVDILPMDRIAARLVAVVAERTRPQRA